MENGISRQAAHLFIFFSHPSSRPFPKWPPDFWRGLPTYASHMNCRSHFGGDIVFEFARAASLNDCSPKMGEMH